MDEFSRRDRLKWCQRGMVLCTIIFLLIFTAGCAGISNGDDIYQYLDESSGVTVTSLTAPLAFFKNEPMLAANSRDYVYIGPAELNRMGHLEFVLWMNFCTTIDRVEQSGPSRPKNVFLILEGEPMELSQADNSTDLDDLSYASPVIGGTTIVYRITRDQLRLLGRASDVRVAAEIEGGITREYRAWGNAGAGFRNFSRYLDE
jgi:hypothetical protein